MGPDRLQYARDLFGRKPSLRQDSRDHPKRVGEVVPGREFPGILRAMPHKHTEVMHPGCGEQDVVVEADSCAEDAGKPVQPGLMAELSRGRAWARMYSITAARYPKVSISGMRLFPASVASTLRMPGRLRVPTRSDAQCQALNHGWA